MYLDGIALIPNPIAGYTAVTRPPSSCGLPTAYANSWRRKRLAVSAGPWTAPDITLGIRPGECDNDQLYATSWGVPSCLNALPNFREIFIATAQAPLCGPILQYNFRPKVDAFYHLSSTVAAAVTDAHAHWPATQSSRNENVIGLGNCQAVVGV